MALKGKYKFMGELEWLTAYAVIDSVNISKGGDAFCHVSIYKDSPVTKEVEQTRLVANVEEKIMVETTERGNPIEHFSISGVKTNGQDAFAAAYKQVRELDVRLADMVDVLD